VGWLKVEWCTFVDGKVRFKTFVVFDGEFWIFVGKKLFCRESDYNEHVDVAGWSVEVIAFASLKLVKTEIYINTT
jgi:hypothetical protein